MIEGLPLWVAQTNCWIVAPAGPGGECVIIDAPPLAIFTDAAVLINHADGAMLVVRANRTRYASIDRVLKRIAHEIIERNPELAMVALIGIPSRGVLVAERLAAHIRNFGGVAVQTGSVDVSMHRDDLRRRPLLRPVQPTQLPDGSRAVLQSDIYRFLRDRPADC